MANTEVEHPWEQEYDELEEGLVTRRKNYNQIPVSITINADFSNNVASIGVTNGKHQHLQEHENEDEGEEKVKDFSHENQEEKEKQEHQEEEQEHQEEEQEQDDEDEDEEILKPFSQLNGIKVDEDEEEEEEKQQYQQETEDEEKVNKFSEQNGIKVDEDEKEKQKQQTSEYSVYYDTDKGNGLQVESSLVNTNIRKHNLENGNGLHSITIHNGEYQKHEISFEEIVERPASYINSKTDTSEIQVIKDDDDDGTTEYDVETVLKKQDTHDLFCPNCNSCITKRVILRKRKRRIPVTGDDAKRNKPEVNVVANEQPTSDEFDHQREEPDVFRCLSCFSIFMPTGNGFKLFRMFGGKNKEEYNEHSQKEVVPVKKRWFSNFFASNEVEQLNNQGTLQSLDTENNVSGLSRQEANSQYANGTTNLDKKKLQSPISSVGRDENIPLSSTQEPGALEQQIVKESDKTISESNGRIEENTLAQQSNSQSEYPGMFSVKPVENAVSPSQNDGLKFHVPSNVGSVTIENSQTNQGLDVTVQMNNTGLDEKGRISLSFSPLASIHEHSNSAGQVNDQELQHNLAINVNEQKTYKEKDIVHEVTEQYSVQNNVEILDEPLKVDKDVLTNKQIKLLEDFNNIERLKGKDTIITIESKQTDTFAFQSLGEAGISALQQVQSGSQAVQQGGATMATGGGRSLDIIKCIVYGGLIELITSLSVVSSAAGADAATLNVLAIGLANIFGGLFVIGHDLWGLKHERTRKSEDRYQILLGQRTDFPLHMVVSLISYLVFGFLPPIVYAFSFRASNDKDLKLLMVAVASIVCILILAAAKAHVQSPRKSYFKTISYYVVFGFMVSGVSYLCGGLIIKLLEKMDLFHSGSVNNLSIHGVSSKPAFVATY